jgi:hypothetical protein
MSEEFNPLAKKIVNALTPFCAMPGPVVSNQCRRIGKTTANLTEGDLPQLAPYIGKAIQMFSNPEQGKKAQEAVLNCK